jgi:hypothetical protein
MPRVLEAKPGCEWCSHPIEVIMHLDMTPRPRQISFIDQLAFLEKMMDPFMQCSSMILI